MSIIIKNRFMLLYGSQTGQAKAIAEEIAEKGEEQGLEVDLHCLSQTDKKFNIERESCIVFVISTTGEGDPPDTAVKFMRRLRKKTLPNNYLNHLKFTVLGLGDSNYTNFCNCGQSLNERLLELGAEHFYPPDWADDAVGLEVVVEPWMEKLFSAVKEQISDINGKKKGSSEMNKLTLDKDDHTANEITNDNMKNKQDQESDIIKTSKTNMFQNSNSNNVENSNSNNIENSNSSNIESLVTSAFTKEDENKQFTEPCLRYSNSCLCDSELTLPAEPPSFINVEFDENKKIDINLLPRQNDSPFPSSNSDIGMATVLSAKVLTAEDAVKKTLKLSLDIEKCGFNYEPGDSISIICPNKDSEVTQILKRLNIEDKANCVMKLSIIPETKKKRAAIPQYIYEESTIRHILTTCIDIREPPKKALLRAFVEYTSNHGEKRRLQELCSKQGAEEYSKFIREQSISLIDILMAFPTCKPPIQCILEHSTRLKPRPYSACSSPTTNKNVLDIVFNVIDIPQERDRHSSRKGVCTGWLDDITKPIQTVHNNLCENLSVLSVNSNIQIPVFYRTNQHFRPPIDVSHPVIFIGPGTGVAPFIGFLAYRQHQLKILPDGSYSGDTWLFYGCRNKKKDFLFEDELNDFVSNGTLHHLCVSFSRDDISDADAPKYVQDYLLKEIDNIFDIIENDKSVIYVCGDATNMAKDVNEAFCKILISKKGLSEADAKAYLLKMRLYKRYLEDVWT